MEPELLVCVLELVQQVEHELEHESTTRPKKNTTTKPKRAANPAKTSDSGLPTRSRGILRPAQRTARQDMPVREMHLGGVSSAIFPAASPALYYEARSRPPEAGPPRPSLKTPRDVAEHSGQSIKIDAWRLSWWFRSCMPD